MKKIKIDSEVLTLDGHHFHVNETDTEGLAVMVDGSPKLKIAKLSDLLRILVFNLPPDRLTMQDSLEAYRFITQLNQPKDGTVALEEAEFDWIKKKIEEYATLCFGVNAIVLKQAVEKVERE